MGGGREGAPLRVCYFGTYRAEYSRNQVMIEGLRRSGVEVVECHEALWHGVEDRVEAASGKWLSLSFLRRIVGTTWRLWRRHRRLGYDVMVLGYPGQLDALMARLLTWLRGKPLVMDVFMSLWLIAHERGLTASHPLTGRLLHALEKVACQLPDLLLLDTAEYVEWFHEQYGLSLERFRLVPTGADDRVFRPAEPAGERGPFRVLYYGSYIPNHGVEHIVEAARLLEADGILFELVGRGPTRAAAEARVESLGLTNVEFVDWVEQEDLPARAAAADVCLGVFGVTPQSLMTVQNKIYEGLAMARPVITGVSPTLMAHLVDRETAFMVQRGDPQSLAQAIRTLRDDPELRARLARQGYELFVERYSTAPIGKRARGYLESLLESRAAMRRRWRQDR